jgi:hypothetical protein
MKRLLVLLVILVIPSVCLAQEINEDKLIKAIYLAEGGERAKKPYGILSVPCSTKQSCESVCRNTIRHRYKHWKQENSTKDFISYLGATYAPESCSPLNRNWIKNTRYFYEKA